MDESTDLEISLMPSSIIYRPQRPDTSLSVVEVGRQTVRSMIERRTLPVFAAVLVEKGGGTLATTPSGLVACEAPGLFWLLPGIAHTYGPRQGTSWDERWVLFTGRLAEELRAQGLIDPVAPAIALPVNSAVPRLFRDLQADVLPGTTLGDSAAAASVFRLVTTAAQEADWHQPRDTGRDAEMIAALREMAMRPLDLAAFAQDFGISAATLRRRFIAATGLPPKALQLRLRIDRAKELLATTDAPIEQIARTVGFEDSFYFARLFLGRESLTPSEFRRRHQRH